MSEVKVSYYMDTVESVLFLPPTSNWDLTRILDKEYYRRNKKKTFA
jgi:hypothetical protein